MAVTTNTTLGTCRAVTAPSRRQFGGSILAAACGAAFAGAVVLPDPGEAFPSPAIPDTELLAACAAFDALEAAYRATDFRAEPHTPEATAAEIEQDRITAAQRPLVARMTELRAITHEGRVARARSLIGWWPEVMADGEGTTGECLTYATLRDLVGEA
ncbi:MAG: hypothetical protein ACRYG8_04100 [Janthinobacterium lividum]